MNLPRLSLPPIDSRRIDAGRVFDIIRQKWVTLTPEEWVRQHFVDWMIVKKGYSPLVMANEFPIKVNGLSRRCDTVVFDHYCRPLLIVEYKAPSVAISQRTFDQIVRYNMSLNARYLAVSNGLSHYCCELDYKAGSYRFLRDFPTAEARQSETM